MSTRPKFQKFPESLRKDISNDCGEFSDRVIRLYGNGLLFLNGNGFLTGSEKVDLSLFEMFGPYTKGLSIDCDSLNEVSTLRKFNTLQKVKIVGCGSEATVWSKLPETVIELEISDSLLSKVGSMDHLVNLENLYVRNTKIFEVPNVENLKKLKNLDLKNNSISSIEGLNFDRETPLVVNLIGNPIADYSKIIFNQNANKSLVVYSDLELRKRRVSFQ